jgi:RNA polymerase sigma-70 factor (ECF subfamily)
MNEDDAALLAAVREGSARAFNTLVDRHQQALRMFLRRITKRDEAEDIAQETFLAVWMQAGSYRGGAGVRSWLFAIAWRKAQGVHRSRFRLWRRDSAYHEAAAQDQASTASVEDEVALEQALGRLGVDQRAALVLCLGCGFTHEEAAEALGFPLGTVKSHVLRGRERLRSLLGEEG